MIRLVKLVFTFVCFVSFGASQAIELSNNQQIFLDISGYQWNSSEENLSIRAIARSEVVWQEAVQTTYQVRAEIFDSFSGEITISELIQLPTNQFEFYFTVPSALSYDKIEVVAVNSTGEQRVLDKLSFDDLQLLASESAKPAVQALGESSALITLLNNGPSENRVDFLFLGDGYLESEMDKYEADAAALLELFLLEPPYSDYRNYFNAHRINTPSNESGASHPENGIEKDTFFGAYYNCADIQRFLCIDYNKVIAFLESSPINENQADIILVIVNDPEYGGSGGPVSAASTHSSSSELLLHETAHGFGLLADEYDGPLPSTGSDCATSTATNEPNVSVLTDREGIKWRHWIESNTEIPTPDSLFGSNPGLYRGSKYCGGSLSTDAGLKNAKFRETLRCDK